MKSRVLPSCGFVMFGLVVVAIATEISSAMDDVQNAASLAKADLSPILQDLGSDSFTKRQSAVVALKSASTEQLEVLCSAFESTSDNEVARRLVEILEVHYGNPNPRSPEVKIVSEALEKAAHCDRWFVAEASRDVLDRHWQRRTEMAVLELVEMKVGLSPQDPTTLWKDDPDADQRPFGLVDPTSSQHLKIYINKDWPGNDRAFALLKRLDSLKADSFMTQPRLISIYLIDGHPLKVEQVGILKGIFGDTQIAERSRVCLGILNEPRFGGDFGVFVGSVQRGSSADDAGIRQRDLITAMNGEKVTDFESLVTRLRDFDVGDKVLLHVERLTNLGEPITENIEVTLKGWL